MSNDYETETADDALNRLCDEDRNNKAASAFADDRVLGDKLSAADQSNAPFVAEWFEARNGYLRGGVDLAGYVEMRRIDSNLAAMSV